MRGALEIYGVNVPDAAHIIRLNNCVPWGRLGECGSGSPVRCH
jgi:hypothetical protein